jgi:hypothetical protein
LHAYPKASVLATRNGGRAGALLFGPVRLAAWADEDAWYAVARQVPRLVHLVRRNCELCTVREVESQCAVPLNGDVGHRGKEQVDYRCKRRTAGFWVKFVDRAVSAPQHERRADDQPSVDAGSPGAVVLVEPQRGLIVEFDLVDLTADGGRWGSALRNPTQCGHRRAPDHCLLAHCQRLLDNKPLVSHAWAAAVPGQSRAYRTTSSVSAAIPPPQRLADYCRRMQHWQAIPVAIGGVAAVGFLDEDRIIVGSHSGVGVFDVHTGAKNRADARRELQLVSR